MQQLLTSCGRAVGNRATEPRVSPQNLYHEESIKEIHLKKVKTKSVAKPILQSLRESLEYLKKPATTSNRTKAQTINVNINQNFNTGVGGSSIFECISKLCQSSRCRNPAKKSASFTFSIRPEISMKFNQKYSSLEATEFNSYSCGSVKQSVQRSVSTSALAMPTTNFADSPSSSSACVIQLQPDYSRVRDSLAPPIPKSQLATITSSTQLITTKPDDIYTEICENQLPVLLHPSGHIMARIKILVEDNQHCDRSYQQDYDRLEHREIDRKYVNSIFVGRKQN
ncbi:PREDICTED: uncharacterized protein LOC105365784 [Ceratosolen solmsi marchali]|uniref:Uncharacterized protein LOC105365784 n=1 Tax=Ceratosolen solmsi marchali TaxID=326594 RepID=A0AAJ7DZP7_9HYME|nr:PREDICTED: uncharacterized protein LOC105365784 [Ceratosolen solmsi marchali]